MDYLRKE